MRDREGFDRQIQRPRYIRIPATDTDLKSYSIAPPNNADSRLPTPTVGSAVHKNIDILARSLYLGILGLLVIAWCELVLSKPTMAASSSTLESAAAEAKELSAAVSSSVLRRERRGSLTESDISSEMLGDGPANNFVKPLLTDFYQVSMAYACEFPSLDTEVWRVCFVVIERGSVARRMGSKRQKEQMELMVGVHVCRLEERVPGHPSCLRPLLPEEPLQGRVHNLRRARGRPTLCSDI